MKKIGSNWPAIRQVVYSVLTALLGIAVAAQWISEDQSVQWLSIATQILGAVGFVVAALFVDRTSPAQEEKIERAVESGVERAVTAVQPHVEYARGAVNEVRRHVDPFIRPGR